MKLSMLIGAAALALAAPAFAQDAPLPPPPPTGAPEAPPLPPPPNDMSAQQMPQSDPNAGVPTGTVPANPGMVPADPNVPANSGAPVGSSANPVVMGGNATPPPEAKTDYPVCSKTVKDSCINPGEAHKAKRKR